MRIRSLGVAVVLVAAQSVVGLGSVASTAEAACAGVGSPYTVGDWQDDFGQEYAANGTCNGNKYYQGLIDSNYPGYPSQGIYARGCSYAAYSGVSSGYQQSVCTEEGVAVVGTPIFYDNNNAMTVFTYMWDYLQGTFIPQANGAIYGF